VKVSTPNLDRRRIWVGSLEAVLDIASFPYSKSIMRRMRCNAPSSHETSKSTLDVLALTSDQRTKNENENENQKPLDSERN